MTQTFKVGQLIELNDARVGTIRYLGQTQFAPGEWVGVEFGDAIGKNDGSVQGVAYFECEPEHGMFLKSAGIKRILEQPTPKATKSANVRKDGAGVSNLSAKPTPRTAGPQTNGVKRPSAMDPLAAKRQSMNSASPTPGPRRQSLLNGQKVTPKPTTRTAGSTTATNTASRRESTQQVARPQQSTRVAPTTTSRSSLLNSRTSSESATRAAPASATRLTRPARPSIAASSSSRTIVPHSGEAKTTNGALRSSAAPSSQQPTTKEQADFEEKSNDSSPQSEDTNEDTNETSVQDDEYEPGQETKHVESKQDANQKAEVNIQYSSSRHYQSQQELGSSKQKAGHIPETSRTRITADGRKVQELQAQIEIYEKKHAEDQKRVASLEKLQAENEKLTRVIQSLRHKYDSQAEESKTLKVSIKEYQTKLDSMQTALDSHEADMESVTIDCEYAEEQVQGLKNEKLELEKLLEQMQLELEVLTEENEEFSKDVSPEERSSQTYIQLERRNARLEDALIRLRDYSQDTENKLQKTIAELQEELEPLDEVTRQCNEAKQQLAQSESIVENLKQQLEAALTSEEMVEELTETNDNLNGEISRIKMEIDELQTMNELNDEFELQHQENEKQMQEEIDSRGAELSERIAWATQQDQKLLDQEYTITRFREYVTSLQSHLEDMKASQQLSEAETEELNSRSKAMADLNVKLQSAAAKTQVNTIDLEIRGLEAEQAVEHLNIIQMFLPDEFKSERNSIMAYLRFKRIAFKSNLLHRFIRERVLSTTKSSALENPLMYCDLMGKLIWLATMCDRFIKDVASSSLEQFAQYESSLQDLEPVERGLTRHIELYKKDDFNVLGVVEELQRSIAVLSHLSEVHIRNDLSSYADDVLMRTTLMQNHLENAACALTVSRSFLEPGMPEKADGIGENEDNEAFLGQSQRIEGLISQSRSAKVVASKVIKNLDELRTRSMSLDPSTSDLFDQALKLTESVASNAISFGKYLQQAIENTEDSMSPLPSALRQALASFGTTSFPSSQNPTFVSFAEFIRSATDALNRLLATASDLSRTNEFSLAKHPWLVRADAVKENSLSTVNNEAEVERLKEVIQQRLSQLKERDERVDEQNIKIEFMESRMREANAKAGKIEALQRAADDARKRENELVSTLEKQSRDVHTIQAERDTWKLAAEERSNRTEGFESNDVVSTKNRRRKSRADQLSVTFEEREALELEIKSLKDAVKHLRSNNFRSNFANPATNTHLGWLRQPLFSSRNIREESVQALASAERGGLAAFGALFSLATSTKMVDLSRLPENKLAWRPTKEKTSWQVAKQAEEWEIWCSKRDSSVNMCLSAVGTKTSKRPTRPVQLPNPAIA